MELDAGIHPEEGEFLSLSYPSLGKMRHSYTAELLVEDKVTASLPVHRLKLRLRISLSSSISDEKLPNDEDVNKK